MSDPLLESLYRPVTFTGGSLTPGVSTQPVLQASAQAPYWAIADDAARVARNEVRDIASNLRL